MPSHPRPPPKPKPSRFRVLSPETAKARSLPSSRPSGPPGARNANPPSPGTQQPRPSLLSALRARFAALPSPLRRSARLLRHIAPLVPIGMFFSEHVMQVVWVRGSSMAPFLNDGYEQTHTKSDVVLVSMWPWTWPGWPAFPWSKERERRRRMERGMLVTFRSPANPTHVAVKRIIGLPGDRVSARPPYAKESQIVPFNHVWLEGDAADPKKSLDSNTYGPVSMSLVTGRVVAVLRPRFRWLNWADWENGVFDNGDSGTGPVVEYRKGVRDRVVKGAVELERPVG